MDLKVGPESLENDDDFSSPHIDLKFDCEAGQ